MTSVERKGSRIIVAEHIVWCQHKDDDQKFLDPRGTSTQSQNCKRITAAQCCPSDPKENLFLDSRGADVTALKFYLATDHQTEIYTVTKKSNPDPVGSEHWSSARSIRKYHAIQCQPRQENKEGGGCPIDIVPGKSKRTRYDPRPAGQWPNRTTR
jgi:hypothetical protein